MNNFITSYCSINANKIVLNDELLFQQNIDIQFIEFIKAAYKSINLSYLKFFKMDNLCKLGFINAEYLFKNSNIFEKYDKARIGIILNNYSSSLDTDLNYQSSINDKENYFPSPSVFVYTLPNIIIGEIAIRHKIFGENLFNITKSENQEFNINYINILLNENIIDCCIAGSIDIYNNNYKSIFYIVEKTNDLSKDIIFEKENLKKIYTKI